jgi:RsiW-degrading membrane proteinase PrsW (M82 family)
MILASIVAIAVPIAFLFLVRWLDLYASGSFKAVVICFGWGLAAYFLAFQVNTFLLPFVGLGLILTLFAPIVEEIGKSLILIYYVRRPDFTYFVDGAIYGFAAGAAFAILETNLLYLNQAGPEGTLLAALSRSFSTALMHGSATALVGVSLGLLRFGRGLSRVASVLLGWAAAMTLHIVFNNISNSDLGLLKMVLAIVLGLGGVGLNAALIFWGLNDERKWLCETLQLDVGVSAGESAVVQQMDDLDRLLAPIAQRFGAEKRKQVEKFLQLQAQLGLKRKVQEMTPDAKLREEMATQIAAIRAEMDTLRRAVGVYCMAYVRSILPPETEPLWTRLAQAMETQQPRGPSLWTTLNERMKAESSEQ